ncbi:MAG: hypothetical protein ABEL76_08960 [Bradymonadaceae bacterium]
MSTLPETFSTSRKAYVPALLNLLTMTSTSSPFAKPAPLATGTLRAPFETEFATAAVTPSGCFRPPDASAAMSNVLDLTTSLPSEPSPYRRFNNRARLAVTSATFGSKSYFFWSSSPYVCVPAATGADRQKASAANRPAMDVRIDMAVSREGQ